LPPPENPLLRFHPHACATKFSVAPPGHSHEGQLYVALFGDEAPMTTERPEPVGRKVVRVDPNNWKEHDLTAAPVSRPIDVRFDPLDGVPWVLDFGFYEAEPRGRIQAQAGSGRLWKCKAWA
jgi:hypothetical protein